MSYLALYRKYRPTDFDSVCGQNDTVTVIKNAIVNNKISHAYLFSGPRGTGKTTIAKIIARLVNCENLKDGNACGKCYNCLNFLNSNDIVEIDAASNNGVDEIREIREKVNLVPSNSKYKVYIIDEVHMLTNQAFNALLKTLEEPPKHVIFILATTEPHKIPLTISSRCQKFSFTRISDDDIVDRLKFIAKKEKIKVDTDSLYEIARISDGGMRDAINLLDQLAAYNNSIITINDIYNINGSVSYDNIFKLLEYIRNNDKQNIINFVDNINKNGCDIKKFIEELIVFIKDIIVYINTGNLSNIEIKNENIKKSSNIFELNTLYDFIEYLNNQLNSIIYSTHSQIIFMTILLKYASNFNSNEVKIISREIISNEKKDLVEDNNSKLKNTQEEKKAELESGINFDVRINNALATASKKILTDYKKKWSSFNEYVTDNKYSVAAGLLIDANLVVASEKYAILTNNLESIVDRINENSLKIEKFLKFILKNELKIVAITDSKWKIIKNEYIDNIKKGYKYEVIEEKIKNEASPVDKLIDIIGDDLVDYK